jgi:HK97 family phage portal protein
MGWLDRLQTKDVFIPADAHLDAPLPRTRYPYRRDVEMGLGSNVVMSPINWLARNFTEADVLVERKRADQWVDVPEHPLADALARPNPFITGGLLWKATVTSFSIDGNAYWQKVRNAFGGVIGFWYLPHFLVNPQWPRDGSEFISHYEYSPEWGGPKINLAVRDVVHFRAGQDPRNPRIGMSKLKPLLREVFTDDEAANFSASILRNMGVPGGVIAPKDGSHLPSSEDVKEMKEYMKTGFTGDKRGDWLVLGTPTETSQFGFNPQNLMLGNLRDIAEERVCAALGIPAAVVGFGSGLQSTKVGATMRELREEAWDSTVTPMQNDFAEQLGGQVVDDFTAQPRRLRVRFDTSAFAAAQEKEKDKTERIKEQVLAGILRVDKAQQLLGIEVDEGRAVYLQPAGVVAIPADGSAPPAPSVNGTNGSNGTELTNRVQEALEANNGG